MTTYTAAIETYGSQRVKDPRTGRQVSAYKIGYLSAAPDTLLALYGPHAREVSPRQASYRYVALEGDVTVRHGYLLVKLNADELARAERVTRQSERAAVYLWREDRWHEFPTRRTPDYTPIVGRSGPDFDPAGYRPVSPSTGEKEVAVEGIRAERSQCSSEEKPWWWLSGDTYPHRETLRRYGARFSKRRKAWYFIGHELPAALRALVSVFDDSDTRAEGDDLPPEDEIPNALDGEDRFDVPAADETPFPPAESGDQAAPSEPITSDSEPADIPHIRVIKPQTSLVNGSAPDEVQRAIQQAKTAPADRLTTSLPRATRKTLVPIGQTYVGELTGSITGQVFCFGYAIHDGICVFVNMGGPRMAVEAIRAKFSKGDIVNLVPWDAPAIELTAGEGNSGMYTDYLQNIPEAKFTSLILLHEWLTQPNYGGSATTFIIRTSDEQAMAKLKHHVMALVKVPVFDTWSSYLYHAGQAAMLVRKTRAGGGIDLLTVTLDTDAWTRLITGGVEQQVITLPDTLQSTVA